MPKDAVAEHQSIGALNLVHISSYQVHTSERQMLKFPP
jgi:hypothetical protein